MVSGEVTSYRRLLVLDFSPVKGLRWLQRRRGHHDRVDHHPRGNRGRTARRSSGWRSSTRRPRPTGGTLLAFRRRPARRGQAARGRPGGGGSVHAHRGPGGAAGRLGSEGGMNTLINWELATSRAARVRVTGPARRGRGSRRTGRRSRSSPRRPRVVRRRPGPDGDSLWSGRPGFRPSARRPPQRARAVGQTRAHAVERRERAVQMLALVRGHHAGAQQGAAPRDRGIQRDVCVHALVEQGLPEQDGLPVVSDRDRDDRGEHVGAIRHRRGLDHVEAQLGEPALQVAGVLAAPGRGGRAPRPSG